MTSQPASADFRLCNNTSNRVGVAVGYKNLGYSEGFDDSSEAWVRVSIDKEGPVADVKSAAV